MTDQERLRRSFAYGNVSLSNPAVTREMIDQEADKMTDQERLRAALVEHRYNLHGSVICVCGKKWENRSVEPYDEWLNHFIAALAAPTGSTPLLPTVEALRDLLECVYQADAAEDTSHLKGEVIDKAREALIAESVRASAGADLQQAIEAIEKLFGPELEDWGLDVINGKLNPRESAMYELLCKAYQISHAFNTKHSCYHVHDDWRKLAASAPGADLRGVWIPCAERMPEHGRIVFVWDAGCNASYVGQRIEDDEVGWDPGDHAPPDKASDITHWMAFPASPFAASAPGADLRLKLVEIVQKIRGLADEIAVELLADAIESAAPVERPWKCDMGCPYPQRGDCSRHKGIACNCSCHDGRYDGVPVERPEPGTYGDDGGVPPQHLIERPAVAKHEHTPADPSCCSCGHWWCSQVPREDSQVCHHDKAECAKQHAEHKREREGHD